MRRSTQDAKHKGNTHDTLVARAAIGVKRVETEVTARAPRQLVASAATHSRHEGDVGVLRRVLAQIIRARLDER
jgi:hypothetical protein